MKSKITLVGLVVLLLLTIIFPTKPVMASSIVEFKDITIPRRTEKYSYYGSDTVKGTLTAGSYSLKNIEYNRGTGLMTMTASGEAHFWYDAKNNKRIRIRVYVYDSLGNRHSISSSTSSSTSSRNVYHNIPSTISKTIPPQLNLTKIEVETIAEMYYSGDGYNDVLTAIASRNLEIKPDPAVAAAQAAQQEAQLARQAAERAESGVLAIRTIAETAATEALSASNAAAQAATKAQQAFEKVEQVETNVLLALQAADEARNNSVLLKNMVNQVLAANVRLTWTGNKTATTSAHEYLNIENCPVEWSIRYKVGDGEYTNWTPVGQQILIALGSGKGLKEVTVQLGLDEEVYATKTTQIWKL